MYIKYVFFLTLSKNYTIYLTFCILIQFSFIAPLINFIQIKIIYLILFLYQHINFLIIILNFATKFSSFRIDLKFDKYLFNTLNIILLI